MMSFFKGLKERIMWRGSSSPCGLGGLEIEDLLIRADFGHIISSKIAKNLLQRTETQ
jgi:hypothetical protein